MIYLGTSVALRLPPLTSSRLIEYEIWTRIHALNLGRSHEDEVRSLLGRIALLVELSPPVLARALEPFPKSIRMLDALHLASMEFLHKQGQRVTLASYDDRLLTAARALRFPFTIYESR